MECFKCGDYHLLITTLNSSNDRKRELLCDYDAVYGDTVSSGLSELSIQLLYNTHVIKRVRIIPNGGGCNFIASSAVVVHDKITLCYGDSVFCLSIPELSLLWKTKADESYCFEIYSVQSYYFIHGELEISCLNGNGDSIWQQSGADIFITPDGTGNFFVTENYIQVSDWNGNEYRFDFKGKSITRYPFMRHNHSNLDYMTPK